jgi:hypothetical protein
VLRETVAVRRGEAETASPGALVGIDEEPIDGVMIGFVRQVGAEYGVLGLGRLRVQAVKDVWQGDLAPSDLHQPLTLRLGDRQSDAAGCQQFAALMGDPQCVHRVLGVVTVFGGQLAGARRVPVADESTSLGVDVSEEGSAGAL